MFKKIRQWIQTKLFLFDEETVRSQKFKSDITSTRDYHAKKRVKKAFEEQAGSMKSRAMKAHDVSCVDPLTCSKRICYVWTPDKIINVQVVEIKNIQKRKKDDK